MPELAALAANSSAPAPGPALPPPEDVVEAYSFNTGTRVACSYRLISDPQHADVTEEQRRCLPAVLANRLANMPRPRRSHGPPDGAVERNWPPDCLPVRALTTPPGQLCCAQRVIHCPCTSAAKGPHVICCPWIGLDGHGWGQKRSPTASTWEGRRDGSGNWSPAVLDRGEKCRAGLA